MPVNDAFQSLTKRNDEAEQVDERERFEDKVDDLSDLKSTGFFSRPGEKGGPESRRFRGIVIVFLLINVKHLRQE